MSLPTPASLEELLAQMVAHNTVNPLFGGPEGGESASISAPRRAAIAGMSGRGAARAAASQ